MAEEPPKLFTNKPKKCKIQLPIFFTNLLFGLASIRFFFFVLVFDWFVCLFRDLDKKSNPSKQRKSNNFKIRKPRTFLHQYHPLPHRRRRRRLWLLSLRRRLRRKSRSLGVTSSSGLCFSPSISPSEVPFLSLSLSRLSVTCELRFWISRLLKWRYYCFLMFC